MPGRRTKHLAVSAAYATLCLLCIGFIYYTDIRHTLSAQAIFSYWNDYFISTDSFPSFIKSFSEGVRKLTAMWFGKGKVYMRLGSVLIPFFIISMLIRGIKSLKQGKSMICEIDSLGLVIFLELIALGALKKYPFTGGRITLFFAPFVFYFIMKGIGYLRTYKALYIISNAYYIMFLAACIISTMLAYLRLYQAR
jgi:hypothetical protein